MKLYPSLLILSFLICSYFISAHAENAIKEGPLLVVVLMVKNEEHVMAATLQPYVDAGIDSYFIFDTGSTDRTVQVTEEFFAKHRIKHFYIEQEPFVDFATSRNRALELAEARFIQAQFMLMVDAEWYMHNVQGLLNFCRQEMHEQTACYFIRLITSQLDYFLPRLMRVNCHVRYVGVVHETIAQPVDGKAPAEIWFEVRTTERGEQKTKDRIIRDRDMLLAFLEKNPDSSRDMFYLAQTYSCLKDWENAHQCYLKRAAMNGWEEENFMTLYRLGEICELRSMEEDYAYWWQEAFHYYLKAYEMRPWRIEPLIRIGHHYFRKQELATAYIFIKLACEVPYPPFDILFVEKDFYTFHRYDLLSQCAGSVGAYDIGEWATRQALQVKSDCSYLYKNLATYIEALQEVKRRQEEEQKYMHLRNVAPAV